MNIGLVGLPNSGKTTVFNALTRSEIEVTPYANVESEPNRGMFEVADDRVGILSEMYKPKKTTYAVIELIDFVGLTRGSAKGGLFQSASMMALIRNTDAVCVVLRNFCDDLLGDPDPWSDLEKLESELLISDLIVAENRLERIEKAYQRGKKTSLLEREETILRNIVEALSDEEPIRALKLGNEAEKMIRGFQFLTLKPMMAVLNSDEDRFGKNQAVLEKMTERYTVIEFMGKFEMELAQLNDQEEITLFMKEMDIKESARERLSDAAYRLLGYISFFTVGADEVRAWSIQAGQSAIEAAGTIHSDLARGFIRAECMSYEDLLRCGSPKKVAETGLLRLEGKNYVVQDGDILNIRFNI